MLGCLWANVGHCVLVCESLGLPFRGPVSRIVGGMKDPSLSQNGVGIRGVESTVKTFCDWSLLPTSRLPSYGKSLRVGRGTRGGNPTRGRGRTGSEKNGPDYRRGRVGMGVFARNCECQSVSPCNLVFPCKSV